MDYPPTAVLSFSTLTVEEGVPVNFDGSGSSSPTGATLSYNWSFGDNTTGTGPTPTHSYTAPGTDQVELTVSDGFGGTSMAFATITVLDEPPQFTADSFTAPQTFTAPDAGSGFGESVASVTGNVAVGAPEDDGTGLVYFYDGVETDTGVMYAGVTEPEGGSVYAYGALITIFKDPNPVPGDEFGASLAVVGSDLIVGAPGSSISGSGNGVVYVFDADIDDPNFGELLATIEIPDAGDATNAQFGASVGATDTNILIGAPGQNGGQGEVYEYEGDPTQSNFGDLVLAIPNATPNTTGSAAQFGAAVAGLGNDIVVGAPDADAGTSSPVGTVSVFDGDPSDSTFGDLLTTITNPDGSTAGFGSAVAAVGSSIVIGSPLDNSGNGKAFLYSPPDSTHPAWWMSTTFIQPGGAGGNFGASVAGSETTAVIGAPGASLGTAFAGVVYVFDADPADSIFGQPIAAVQEPTPNTGDLFGTAVSIDNGALVVGAAGALGSQAGADNVQLYQGGGVYGPGAFVSASSSTTYATGGSYDSVIVSATFTDDNPAATLTATINWGDGVSTPDLTVLSLPAGAYAFAVPHDYTTDAASAYNVIVTLTDGAGDSSSAQTTVDISDPAPVFAAPGLVLSTSTIDEYNSVTVSGTITSPGGIHTNTVSIDWGDMSQSTTIVLPPGVDTFSTSHTYLNIPYGMTSAVYTIQAQVTNEEGKTGTASASVTVTDSGPQISASDLSVTDQSGQTSVYEGDTVTLSGQFTDPGTLNPITVTVDWGDGTTPTVLYGSFNEIATSAMPGLYTFSAPHQYMSSGDYDINVTVSDSAVSASAFIPIVVKAVAPSIRIENADSGSSSPVDLTSVVTQPGAAETETVSWALAENGDTVLSGTGPDFSFSTGPIFDPAIQYIAYATVSDSSGTGSDSEQIVFITLSSTTVTISPPAGGAAGVIAQVDGSGDYVDASQVAANVELDGYGGNETLVAGSGADLLVGGPGANSLVAGSGDDTLVSNQGDDTLVGGSGNDLFLINPGPDPVVVGTAGGTYTLDFSIASLGITLNLGLESGQTQNLNPSGSVPVDLALEGVFNTVIGSNDGDDITLNDSNDLLYAGSGTNTVTGGSGNDSISGGSGNDIIYAGSGNTTVSGGSGSESIVGGSGNDIVYAGSGNTTLTGGTGSDSIVGGTGNDIVYAGSAPSTVTGGSGNDSISGGSGNDILYAGTGNTTVTGGGGNDTIVGGTGNDIIYAGSNSNTMTGGSGNDSIMGGTGNDIIYASNGSNTISGGSGNDSIVGGTGNDIVYAGSGNATITGGGGDDTIVGGTGNDIIYAGSNSNTMSGGSGNDSIIGGTGNDIIYASNGSNTITGGSGSDSILGGTGNDIVYAGSGNTTITGGGGNDTIVGGTGNDIIYAGSNPSTITGGSGNDSILGGSGNDIIYASNGSNTISGGSGSDSILGGSGNDIVYAGSGNTTITGGGGNDTIVGGTGNDIIYGGSNPSTMTGGSGNDSILGGSGNDIIYTSDGDNTVFGGSSGDTIVGGAGDNTIVGGTGNDCIVGGMGNDSIVGGSGDDTIIGGLNGDNTIYGGSGDDSILGGNLDDTITGGTGNDTIVGGGESDSIVGGSGNDIILSGTLSSTIYGGSGDDLIFGDEGNDVIDGGTGNDTIIGYTGNDSIVGGSGDDLIYGGTGQNTIYGGTGNSTISGGGGSDVLQGGGFDSWLVSYASANMTLTNTTLTVSGGTSPASVSTISGFQSAILAAGTGDFTVDASEFSGTTMLQGGTGDDTLIGSSSSDTLVAGTGNDSLVGGGGNDTFSFNASSIGSDVVDEPAGNNIAGLDFAAAPAGITINLGQTGPQTVIPGVLNLTLSDPMGISTVLGSSYDSTIIGNARDDTLVGGGGLNLIIGGSGDDLIEGSQIRVVYLDFTTYELPGQHFYTQEERNEIQAQLEADYADFNYAFTQTQPESGSYTAIQFNDPALVGLEGGVATGIDWRDLNINGSTTLIALNPVSGFSTGWLDVVPADLAGVNVNNLLGGPGEPAATSADFVGLSATIAAHELGHLSGLEHGDSFGPIGDGIYSGVNPSLYQPAYTGPTDAYETPQDIMASGNSVGTSLEDALDDPYFGARDAIKLSYGENGSPTNEQTAPHYTMATAQPITLEPLVVPDTILEGTDSDTTLDVTAADVVGYLGATGGVPNTDFYSFTAQAGTLINLQVMSVVLINPSQGPFSASLTLYNSSGQVVAYDDASFQDLDPILIDVTLPTTGTYYVEVANKAPDLALTGNYELFMYTFATGSPLPAGYGDSLYAGSGDDTIVAGSADDTIAGATPEDTIVYGSGTVTQLSAAPILFVSIGPNQTVNEGQSITLSGTFIDPNDTEDYTYAWTATNSLGEEVALGSGSSFVFTPGNAGTYTISYTVSDQDGGSGSASMQVTAQAVPPVLTAPVATQYAVEGESATINLGSLTVAGSGPWTLTVQWGNGHSSTLNPTGSGPLSYSYTYSYEGSYTISESVTEYLGDTASITLPNPIVVADQPVVVAAVPVSATIGVPTGNVLVATFTDPEGLDPLGLSAYSASIDWNNTGSTPGMITYDSSTGTFSVSGSETFSQTGMIPFTVAVTHGSAAAVLADGTATVGAAASSVALTVPASVVYGQAATFTATVTGYGTPIGSVAFYSAP